MRWYEKAAMLLCANDDVSVARALLQGMLADKWSHPKGALCVPAFALVHRFGAQIRTELLAA